MPNKIPIKQKPVYYHTYLHMINTLPGTELFTRYYTFGLEGSETDVLKNGKLAAAYMVSFILAGFGWVDRPHVTLSSFLEAIVKSGWAKTEKPHMGDIIVYQKQENGPDHCGFYLDKKHIISHDSYETHLPVRAQIAPFSATYYTRDFTTRSIESN